MAAVVRLRLQFDGDAQRFLQDVAALVETIKAASEDSVTAVMDVRELPVLIDPALLLDACSVVSSSIDGLDKIESLVLQCRRGLQEGLARSALALLPAPFPLRVQVVDEEREGAYSAHV